MEGNQMTKAEINALEKVFLAEIDMRLPFQSKAKIYERLCEDGLLERIERKLGGNFPVVIRGYGLTHAGRYAYCNTCEVEEGLGTNDQ